MLRSFEIAELFWVDASKSSPDDHNSASHIPVPNLTKPKKPSIPKYLPAQAIFRQCLSRVPIAATLLRVIDKVAQAPNAHSAGLAPG
jgi:hypothetical protein